MTARAAGSFEVTMSPLADIKIAHDDSLGGFSINKRYEGDLSAKGLGTMLSAGTKVKGSAGYVAMELVTGTLHGRRGSFVLQHSGTMTRGTASLLITVVPDSGTGLLAGLAGTMSINVAGGAHAYELEYTLEETD